MKKVDKTSKRVQHSERKIKELEAAMYQSTIWSWQAEKDGKGNHCRKIDIGKSLSWGYGKYS